MVFEGGFMIETEEEHFNEEYFNSVFAGTGWKVLWNDGWLWRIAKNSERYDYRSVVLESPDGTVLVNAGTTGPSDFKRYGRGCVFTTAVADMCGRPRPYSSRGSPWINAVGYRRGPKCRMLEEPKWYAERTCFGEGGKCLVGSVEEFALKLAAFGWSERVVVLP